MYYLSFVYLWILYFVEKKYDKRLNKYALLPFLVIPFLRFGVGSDYFSYQYLYDYLPVDTLKSALIQFPNIEPGFTFIMFIGRKIGLSFHFYFGIISIAITFTFYKSIRAKDEIILGMILYYSLFYLAWNLNAIRQGIVILLFTSYYFKQERSLIKSIVIILLLSSIHISALILIPLVLVSCLNLKPIHVLLFAIGGIIFSRLPFGTILVYFKDFQYLGKAYDYLDLLNPKFIDFPSLMRLVLFAIVFAYFYKLPEQKESERKLAQFYLIGLSLYFYFKPVEIIASRTSVYGYFLIVLILPKALKEYKNSKYRIDQLILVFILSFSTFGIYKELHGAAVQTGFLDKPYKLNFVTILNKDRDKFYHTFNIMYNIKDSTKADFDVFYKDKDMSIQPAKDEQYLAVKFPNENLYGIIDREGNVIEKAKYKERPKIYGKYVQDKSGILSVQDISYRIIGTDNLIRTFRIIKDIEKQENNQLLNKTLNFPKEVLTYDEIKQNSFRHYFQTEANGRMEKVSYHIPLQYEIIQTHLRREPIVMITSINDKPYESKIYFSVKPYEGTDILIAETEHNYEYINSKGETIWLEAK